MWDPQVKDIINVQSLVQYFCQTENLTSSVTDWLVDTGGKYLTIVLDGYDEISEENKNHFIMDEVIGRQKLPNCDIVVTSRPAASSHLHDTVDCGVEILGSTEED